MPTLSQWIVSPALWFAGFFLPGYLLARLVRSPAPLLSAFCGSAVVLFYLVLGLDAAGVALRLPTMAAGLGGISVVLAVAARNRRPGDAAAAAGPSWRPRGAEWLWAVPALLGLAAIAVRAVLDPLSGLDNIFRWDFLARQMLRTGTLQFYPPVTAHDFELYGWCDGIPPLVPVLNFWSYLSAGGTSPLATAPRVIIEAVLLFHAVWRLARGVWGAAAGWPATAALATSALALWGVAMGQETGLTALSLVAMLLFLDEYRRGSGQGCLFWAGLAAGLGGLSREYALSWPLIGLVTLAWQGQCRGGWKIFCASAAAVAAPWYLRNWLHTGNPLFAHNLAGLFPTNPMHDELTRIIVGLYSIGGHADFIPPVLIFLLTAAGLLIALGVAGAVRGKSSTLPLVGATLVVSALWISSLSQTAGNWTYATRVLTPALAVGAVLAGGVLAGVNQGRKWVAAGVMVFAADAALRSLHQPMFPLEPPWRLSFTRWLEPRQAQADVYLNPAWKIIADTAQGRGIIVDHPAFHAVFANLGATPIPVTSPAIAFVFDEKLSFAEILARLRAGRIRFVIFSEQNRITDQLVQNHAFLHELRDRHAPVFHGLHIMLYDLDLLTP